METEHKDRIECKINFLKLALKIRRSRYHGEQPSPELLKKAHELGQLAGVSKEELENL